MEITTTKYICSKDAFLEAKAYQKKLTEFGKQLKKYLSENPEPDCFSQKHEEWLKNIPGLYTSRADLKNEARHHNIVYSVIRGKTYSQIESKVAKYNEPSSYSISFYLKKYGIDWETFKKAAQYEE